MLTAIHSFLFGLVIVALPLFVGWYIGWCCKVAEYETDPIGKIMIETTTGLFIGIFSSIALFVLIIIIYHIGRIGLDFLGRFQ